MRWANYIGNRLFAIFLSILINKPVSDSLCGTKVFSRKFFKLMKNYFTSKVRNHIKPAYFEKF